jgi:hypothetical protein
VQTLKTLLDSPAVNVFLGTLPLLCAIVWGLLQNDRSLRAIDKRMDVINSASAALKRALTRLMGSSLQSANGS